MGIYESESRKLRTRAEELMRKLTLDEKIGMVHGAHFPDKGSGAAGHPAAEDVRRPDGGAAGIPCGVMDPGGNFERLCNISALQQRACIYMEQRTCIRNRLCTWRGNERTGERCYPRPRSEY